MLTAPARAGGAMRRLECEADGGAQQGGEQREAGNLQQMPATGDGQTLGNVSKRQCCTGNRRENCVKAEAGFVRV